MAGLSRISATAYFLASGVYSSVSGDQANIFGFESPADGSSCISRNFCSVSAINGVV